jgi:hypothetical protein
MKEIRTLHDARREKWAMDAAQAAKHDALEAEAKAKSDRVAAILRDFPAIGVLQRPKGPVYYAWIEGQLIEAADPAIVAHDLKQFD